MWSQDKSDLCGAKTSPNPSYKSLKNPVQKNHHFAPLVKLPAYRGGKETNGPGCE